MHEEFRLAVGLTLSIFIADETVRFYGLPTELQYIYRVKELKQREMEGSILSYIYIYLVPDSPLHMTEFIEYNLPCISDSLHSSLLFPVHVFSLYLDLVLTICCQTFIIKCTH